MHVNVHYCLTEVYSIIFLFPACLQVLIDDAQFLMNLAAAGEHSWDDIRPQIADKYQQAGLLELADFANAVQ